MKHQDPSQFINHTITPKQAKEATAIAERWLEFADTRRATPLTILMACAIVHSTIAAQGRSQAGASEEESDELLRTLIALTRGAAQS